VASLCPQYDADLRQSLMLFRTENPATAAFLSLIAKPTTDHDIPGHCLMLRAADFNAKTHPVFHLTS
jgi:hypothetical protein